MYAAGYLLCGDFGLGDHDGRGLDFLAPWVVKKPSRESGRLTMILFLKFGPFGDMGVYLGFVSSVAQRDAWGVGALTL